MNHRSACRNNTVLNLHLIIVRRALLEMGFSLVVGRRRLLFFIVKKKNGRRSKAVDPCVVISLAISFSQTMCKARENK